MEIDSKKVDFDKMKSDESLKNNLNANQTGNIDGVDSGVRYNPAPPTLTPNYNQSSVSLKKPTELLSEAWEMYKARWKTLLGIVAVPILLMLLAFLLFIIGTFGVALLSSFFESSAVNIAVYSIGFVLILALFLAIIIIQFWSQVALIYAIKDSGENIGIKESYKRGWCKIKPFIWVSVLSSLIIFSGFILFYIPGIIFSIWFAFAVFIVVAEDLKGMDAILKSREYVRNYWWQIFWRLLFLAVVIIGVFIAVFIFSILIKSVSSLLIGKSAMDGVFTLIINFASVIIAPFTMIYSFLIYGNLKKIKSDFEFKPSAKAKKSFVAVGVLGILAIPLLFSSIVLVSLNSARDKAKDAARRSALTQIKTELLIYYDSNEEYPESLNELNINYVDPETKKPYEYRQLDNGDDYELCALLNESRQCFSSENNASNFYYDKPIRNTGEVDEDEKEAFENNIKNRDKQRIFDLNSVSKMLKRYKEENGIYPVSYTSAKLNENNQVTRKIKSANEDKNIPVDPNDPKYYYTYQSANGKSFEIAARLENLEDKDCEIINNMCIYKVSD